MMQPRFEKRLGSTPFGLVEQPRFRAGFDFLRLRADIAEVDERLADWWQEFSMASDSEREDLVQAAKAEQQLATQAAKPRVRRAPRPAGAAASVPGASKSESGSVVLSESDDGEALKKRRRRRRKPGASADPVADSGSVE